MSTPPARSRRVEFEPVSTGSELFDQTAETVARDELMAEVDDAATAYDAPARDADIDIDIDLTEPVRRPAAATGAEEAEPAEIAAPTWEPVPVPRPVYTTKPPAPTRTRRQPDFEPLLPPVETAAELDPVDDLEEILDRRWAVND